MKLRAISGLALILGVLTSGFAARAQEWGGWDFGSPGGRHDRMGPRLMAMLDNDRVKAAVGLTDQQTNQLRRIFLDTAKESVKTRADLAVRGMDLQELMRADQPNKDAVMKKVQEISELRGEMMKQHVEALLAAKSVLTPEQQKKVQQFIESRRAEMWRQGPRQMRRGGPERPGHGPGPEPRHGDEKPGEE